MAYRGLPPEEIARRLTGPVYGAMAEAMQSLVGYVKRDINRGNRLGGNPSLPGEPPKKQTARLFKSINAQVEVDTAGRMISGYVGTNVKYARHLEFGVEAFVTVRPHQRRSRKGKVYDVHGHFRRMIMFPRPFLRPALLVHRTKFVAVFDRALAKRLKGG